MKRDKLVKIVATTLIVNVAIAPITVRRSHARMASAASPARSSAGTLANLVGDGYALRAEGDAIRHLRASRSREAFATFLRTVHALPRHQRSRQRKLWTAAAPQYEQPRSQAVTQSGVQRHEQAIPKLTPVPQVFAPTYGASAWAHSRNGYRVSNCESGDRRAVDVDTRYNGNTSIAGSYEGKWQVDQDFWIKYGGLSFAGRAAAASESAQDLVAFRGWEARGWEPWSCASIMGVHW